MADVVSPIFAVLLVLGLLGGTLYFLRRRGVANFAGTMPSFGKQTFGKPTSARQLNVVERVSLSGQHALHLVKVGERLILVATAPGSCQMLDAVSGAKL